MIMDIDTQIGRRNVLALGGSFAVAAASPLLAKPSMSSRFNWKLHRPEEVGMSAAGLVGIRKAIQNHIDSNALPGAVTAIARHNKLVWFEAQGVSDPVTKTPMRTDNLFRMMSSTKQVTAVAVMMMIEAGRIALNDKVSRFIPSFSDPKVAAGKELVAAEREITVKDRLTHTSGLGSGGAGTLLAPTKRLPADVLGDYVKRLGAQPLDFQPGSKFAYSPGDGFDTLLRIVEIVSGVPADVFVRERITQPLEMVDTSFNPSPKRLARLVKLHERKDSKWQPATAIFGNGPTKYISGAGGLMSTARDYLQFEAMLLNKGALNGRRLLKPETVALMATNHVGDLYENAIPQFKAMTAGQVFGLGVAVTLDPKAANTGRASGAFGWPGAYGTNSWADPELGISAAFFVQQPNILATFFAANDFARAIRAAIVS